MLWSPSSKHKFTYSHSKGSEIAWNFRCPDIFPPNSLSHLYPHHACSLIAQSTELHGRIAKVALVGLGSSFCSILKQLLVYIVYGILHILYPFTSDLKIKIWFRDVNSIIDTFGALPLGMSVLVTRMDLHLWKRLCPLKRRHVCTHPFALMDLCICWSAKQLMLGSVGLFGSQVPTPQKLPSGRPSGKWLWFPRKVWSP